MNKMQKMLGGPILAISMFGANANAALVDSGMSMIDTSTNLQWLDLTQTVGLTINQALASTFVTTQGYVYATVAQVTTLFNNAGFLSTNNSNNTANDPAALSLLSLLGCTQNCASPPKFNTGRGFAYNAAASTSTIDWYSRPNYHFGPLGSGAAVISLQTTNKNLVDATSGHFLVRAYNNVNVVPIPAALPLFASALVVLGFVARRRRRV